MFIVPMLSGVVVKGMLTIETLLRLPTYHMTIARLSSGIVVRSHKPPTELGIQRPHQMWRSNHSASK
jgi:hypothetical protein